MEWVIKKSTLKKIALSLAVLSLIWLGANWQELNAKLNIFTSPTEINADNLDSYKIIRFSDGDTLDVDMNGKTETIRFLGIDTPETHHPDKGVQCFGPEASQKTEELLSSGRAKLASDSKAKNRDKYGRLLRYIYTEDGISVEETLLQQGYAFVFRGENFDQKQKYLSLESTAQQSKTGLWSACNPHQDKYGAYTTG